MKRSDDTSGFRDFCRAARFYAKITKQVIVLPFKRKIQLRDPQQLLREKLGDDLQVLNFTTDTLVKLGDNFGSTIVKAIITIKRDDQSEKLHLVAKMLPPTQFQRESFQCETTIIKEIFLYEQIIPAYRELYPGEFDIVPKFYGGRLSIKPNATGCDEDAVILLENLRETGYVMEDRLKGLTWNHVRIAVTEIAKFHAIGLAIKRKNPEFFEKIKLHATPLEMPPDILRIFILQILKIIKNHRQLTEYYERVKSLDRIDCTFLEYLEPNDPWACLVHKDIWINNLMFHRNDSEKIDGLKIFDFQSYCFSSPMTDLLYFLFSSLPRELEDFDEAVKLYRETMYETLRELNCNDDVILFEKESFEKRLSVDAKSELYHCVLMSRNIETRSGWDMMKLSATCARRIRRIFEIYESKGWF